MHLKMLISILKSIRAVSERKLSLKVLVICTRGWEADVLCGKSNLCILLWTHTPHPWYFSGDLGDSTEGIQSSSAGFEG